MRINEPQAEGLKRSEKRFIGKGVIAADFTPDMVYMAVGNPTQVEPVKTTDGSEAEVWIYKNYYPSYDAAHMEYAPFTTESVYQPAKFISEPFTDAPDYDGEEYHNTGGPTRTPMGMGRTSQSNATTGGPQGGTMEPADLQAYTLVVLFHEGKVAKFGLKPS